MGYPREWRANSTEPGDHTGVATYKVEGTTYTVPLPSFEDFERIGKALEAAFTSGREAGLATASAHLRRVLTEIDRHV
jgi:hypothetical protein